MKHVYCAVFLSFSFSTTAVADQVIADDLIVRGITGQALLCVGPDCVDGELATIGRDAFLRLKGFNNAIDFVDTSTSSSPDRDWRISANETAGGDAGESFFIRDVTAATNPFYIRGGAPNNSLYVSESGRIGIGTSLPTAEIHVTPAPLSSFPRILLDDTVGTPYQWGIAADSSAFAVRDETIVSFPFVILSGAPSASLRVASGTGNIGMGILSPEVPLHVRRNTGFATDMMRLENNGGVVFRLKDTSPGGQEFTFQSNGGVFRIASPAVPGPEFIMDDFGNVVITGQITTAGSCSAGCDRVFSDEYDLKPLTEHNAMMWAQGHLPNVGPTPEDGPFNLTEKVGGMLNELEHAHIYIGQLHERIATQETELAEQKAAYALLIARLEALESR